MAEFVMYTWDKMGISIRIIADDISQYLVDAGHTVEVITKIDPNVCNKKHVISTREHLSPDFIKMFRFVKPKSYVAIHTRNLEEFTDMEWGAFMLSFMKGDKGGSPIRGVSYSPYQYDQIKERLKKLFSPSVSREILSNTPFVPFGVRDEFQLRGMNDRNQWIVPFNRVTNTQKNMKLHVQLTAQFQACIAQRTTHTPQHHLLFAVGYGPDDTSSEFDLSLYTVRGQPDTRDEYIAQIDKYGMALSTSLYESFGIYYLELLFSGCIVVFLDRPWVRKLLPGYKFVAAEQDLVPMMQAVYENYGAAHRYLTESVLPELEGKYRLRRFVQQLVELSNA